MNAPPDVQWPVLRDSFAPRDGEGVARPWDPPPDAQPRLGAVLLPVLNHAAGPCLIYTVRSARLQHHAGQISFPGGRAEPGDASPLSTALREAWEEINLQPESVEVYGQLEEVWIRPSNFLVRPFVGVLGSDAGLSPDPREVDSLLMAPLAELMAPGVLQRASWRREGHPAQVPLFAIGGREIWGATAALTAQLLARLGWKGWEWLRER